MGTQKKRLNEPALLKHKTHNYSEKAHIFAYQGLW